jgi:hypothetical protein
MVIDSKTKIIKKEDFAIYVAVSTIQGAVMSMEKKTVIKSDFLNKYIKANVAYIDKKRKLAKLENFKVIEEDNSFKDRDRVNFAKKNMAILSFIGTKISAEIIDISPKSISFYLNKIKMLDKIMNKPIEISFKIPTNRTRDKEMIINETVTVSFIDCLNQELCKIVCDFDEASKNKNIIKEYVIARQTEILNELKKINY